VDGVLVRLLVGLGHVVGCRVGRIGGALALLGRLLDLGGLVLLDALEALLVELAVLLLDLVGALGGLASSTGTVDWFQWSVFVCLSVLFGGRGIKRLRGIQDGGTRG